MESLTACLALQVNHFPGNGVFTSKVELAGSLASDFHPTSFRLPKEADSFKDVVRWKHTECFSIHVYPCNQGCGGMQHRSKRCGIEVRGIIQVGCGIHARGVAHMQGVWHTCKGCGTHVRGVAHMQGVWHMFIKGMWYTYKGCGTHVRSVAHVY